MTKTRSAFNFLTRFTLLSHILIICSFYYGLPLYTLLGMSISVSLIDAVCVYLALKRDIFTVNTLLFSILSNIISTITTNTMVYCVLRSIGYGIFSSIYVLFILSIAVGVWIVTVMTIEI
jgi:hypothetical protein